MRISDWSSDVCSSDLRTLVRSDAEIVHQSAPLFRVPLQDGGELVRRAAHHIQPLFFELGTNLWHLQDGRQLGMKLVNSSLGRVRLSDHAIPDALLVTFKGFTDCRDVGCGRCVLGVTDYKLAQCTRPKQLKERGKATE